MTRFLKITCISFAFISLVGIMDSCKSKGPYNPYLELKKKPSQLQLEADKKAIKKGNKAYKWQLGTNRWRLFGRRKPPKH